MAARDEILGKLRQSLGEDGATERKRAADARIASHEQTALIPAIGRLEGRDRVERFIAEAEKVHATVERLAQTEDLPDALARAMRQSNSELSVRMGDDQMFAALDWGPVATSRGPGRIEEPATLSRASAGVSETGTLALFSGPENPVTLTFLGETHYAVLSAKDIEANLEGVWARIRRAGLDPRTVNFVTGPSRTADIAQTLELGAHGPVALHIFLIDDL